MFCSRFLLPLRETSIKIIEEHLLTKLSPKNTSSVLYSPFSLFFGSVSLTQTNVLSMENLMHSSFKCFFFHNPAT